MSSQGEVSLLQIITLSDDNRHLTIGTDLFALRSWSAEAYNTIIGSPPFNSARNTRIKQLTIELASIFEVFWPKTSHMNDIYLEFQNNCIKPAMMLHEKMLISTDHFYTDINPYILHDPRQGLISSPDFVDHVESLDLSDILQNRKKFSLAKLDHRPTRQELRQCLTNVVTLVPALYMRRVMSGDVLSEETLVRKQQLLVTWEPPEKKDKLFREAGRTVFRTIVFTKPDRHQKPPENSFFGPRR